MKFYTCEASPETLKFATAEESIVDYFEIMIDSKTTVQEDIELWTPVTVDAYELTKFRIPDIERLARDLFTSLDNMVRADGLIDPRTPREVRQVDPDRMGVHNFLCTAITDYCHNIKEYFVHVEEHTYSKDTVTEILRRLKPEWWLQESKN